MEIATVLDNAMLRLRIPRREAARELQAQIKIGQAIRSQRIREMRDLEEARREKQEWIQRTTEQLAALVNSEAWAEQFNDYVPTILPEFAEFDMFVDVFEEEMKARLGKLNGLLKSLNNVPEPPPLGSTTQQAPAAHPEVAAVESAENPMTTMTQPAPVISTNPLAEPDPPRMPGQAIQGALIIRTPDDVLRQGLAQFVQKMGITLYLIERQNPSGPSMVDLLASQKSFSFALVMVDANNGAGTSPDDLFDLGCCVGRLGPGRVFAIHRGGESTTDRHGIAHIPVDNTEGWQLVLARQLKKAGVAIDLNKLV